MRFVTKLGGNDGLPKIPGYTTSDLRIREIPVHGSLITGIHTGATLNAIFYLKMDLIVVIHGITISRAYPGCTFMRAG
jgi:hypothetical protein